MHVLVRFVCANVSVSSSPLDPHFIHEWRFCCAIGDDVGCMVGHKDVLCIDGCASHAEVGDETGGVMQDGSQIVGASDAFDIDECLGLLRKE